MNTRLLPVATLLAALALPASAERKNELQVLIGPAVPTSPLQIQGKDDIGKGGAAIGARFLHHLSPAVWLGGEFTLLGSDEAESTSMLTNGNTRSRFGSALTFQGGLDFTLSERINLGLAGAWYRLGQATYEATPDARGLGLASVKGSITSLAFLANLAYRF